MNSNTSNIDNIQQYCKGCEKKLAPSLFITNGKSYRTCNICRLQNKASYQRHKQQSNAEDQVLIELDDFSDKIFDAFENTISSIENKENETNTKFRFSSIVNIVTLKGDSKERANDIIKIISDVDEYIWV